MKKPWLWMLISAAIGLVAAWGVNSSRYGGLSEFGPFNSENDLTAATVGEAVKSATRDGTPVAVVQGETTHDFGVMSPGDEGEVSFTVVNQGQAPLDLRLGASTCKCTLGSLEKDSVAPGESTDVRLSWTIKAKETNFAQSAEVLTNDPARPALRFQITGTVVSGLDVVPANWTVGEVASGDPFEVSGTIYNFHERDIEPEKVSFSDPEMAGLADISVEQVDPADSDDAIRSAARQAFRIEAKVLPGLRQGSFSRQLLFSYRLVDPDTEDGDSDQPSAAPGGDPVSTMIPVSGRIVGRLSMIMNDQIKEVSGAYIFDLGRIEKNDPLSASAFVVLKGKDRDNVKLRIGEVSPDDVVSAKLGDPKGNGSMKLYPLQIELIPGTESVERRGLNKDDYGTIWIESDNPSVPKMRVALKFLLDGR